MAGALEIVRLPPIATRSLPARCAGAAPRLPFLESYRESVTEGCLRHSLLVRPRFVVRAATRTSAVRLCQLSLRWTIMGMRTTATRMRRKLATWSNSRRVQRSPLYAVPVFVLSVPLQTVHRYRRRRPDFVANKPWPTRLRPGFPRLSHPGVPHATPSISFIAQVYGGGRPVVSVTTSELKVTDQQRPAQAPACD